MKKRVVIGVISTGLLLLGAMGSGGHNQSSKLETVQTSSATSATRDILKKIMPVCDGTKVTAGCTLDGANYKTYIYHPAVAEKSHIETETTYREEVTGYCTLCIDGTYSPSCAIGRGACSHHGGVAQWNAPVSSSTPVNNTKTVVDAPAHEAYYEMTAG